MGLFHGDVISMAARTILGRLAAVPTLRYSELCDFEDVDMPGLWREFLACELSGDALEEEVTRWIERGEESPELAIQFAAEQLGRAGLITVDHTDEPLPYEELDFVMGATEAGRAFVASGQKFDCVGVDL